MEDVKEVLQEIQASHKIYGFITEQQFYAGINEAKMENVFIDEKGWVDVGGLIVELWNSFAEGRYAILPKDYKLKHKVMENGPGFITTDISVPEVKKLIKKVKKIVNPIEVPNIETSIETIPSAVKEEEK
jgi:hypothetical protein